MKPCSAEPRDLRLSSLSVYVARLSGASVAPIGEFTARFARTIILSRILGPSELGGTVVLVTILTTCELIADVGLGLFVMVNSGNNRTQVAAAARQIGIIRGVLLSLLIVVSAPFLADVFGASGQSASLRWLGILPLIRSFRNWRTVQIQGEYIYRPEAVASVISHLAAVIVVLPAAVWFRDERAMLVSLFVESALYVIVSHLVLPRERVVTVDPSVRWAALTYGLPLVVNAIGLVAMSQLDRVIIANLFGLEVLALYSLVAGLAFVPISVLLLILGKVLMAFILGAQEDAVKSRRASLITAWIYFANAAIYTLAVGALLDVAVPILYGRQYEVPAGLHALVTLIVFPKICRGGLSTIFLTYTQTPHLTAANILAGVGLVIGFFFGISFQRVEAVMIGMLIGEVFSLFAMLKFASPHLPMGPALLQLAVLAVPPVLAAVGAFAQGSFAIETRAVLTLVGVLVIGVDILMTYRRTLARVQVTP